jgi:hypothetical protein
MNNAQIDDTHRRTFCLSVQGLGFVVRDRDALRVEESNGTGQDQPVARPMRLGE